MSENDIQVAEETATEETTTEITAQEEENTEASTEEISYHAVENDGEITAIWEMQGEKHLRTIDPRSQEGKKIFSLFTSEIHETDAPPIASEVGV
ncbi:MAG: hypothetical protein ACK5NT_14315 [Pyrinomonadaceae bacterium]